MNEQYVVVAGSLSEGFTVYGPFKDLDAAWDFGSEIDHAGSWYAMPLVNPEDVEKA